jgi:purine nucleosidase
MMILQRLRQPILIDTDIGDDADDAFALALALAMPELDVVGVITVAGPVEARARLARIILAAAGRPDITVVPGSNTRLDGRPGPARLTLQPVLEKWSSRSEIEPTPLSNLTSPTSTDFLLTMSRQHRPLTIVAIGPLTNIAAALDADPSLAGRARLVAMAGTLGLPYPDWNLRCDPSAARRVLRSGMPITLVGRHVTMRAKMRPSQIRRLFERRKTVAVELARCLLAWRTRKRRMPILHGTLAIAVAADPTLVRLDDRRVLVGWRGFSVAGGGLTPNALVCTAVDIARFHSFLDDCLLGGMDEEQSNRQAILNWLVRMIA